MNSEGLHLFNQPTNQSDMNRKKSLAFAREDPNKPFKIWEIFIYIHRYNGKRDNNKLKKKRMFLIQEYSEDVILWSGGVFHYMEPEILCFFFYRKINAKGYVIILHYNLLTSTGKIKDQCIFEEDNDSIKL